MHRMRQRMARLLSGCCGASAALQTCPLSSWCNGERSCQSTTSSFWGVRRCSSSPCNEPRYCLSCIAARAVCSLWPCKTQLSLLNPSAALAVCKHWTIFKSLHQRLFDALAVRAVRKVMNGKCLKTRVGNSPRPRSCTLCSHHLRVCTHNRQHRSHPQHP